MHKLAHTFTATHCGQTYAGPDGAAALEAHMKAAHKRRTIAAGSDNCRMMWTGTGRTAPGWKAGKPEAPAPWKAPKAPADTLGLTKVLAKHEDRGPLGRGDVLEWHTEALVSADELAPGDVFTLRNGTERYRVIDAHPSPIEGNPLEIQLEIVGKPGPARWLPMAGRKKLVAAPVVLLERAS